MILTSLPLLLTAVAGAIAVPSVNTGFEDHSLRTIKLSPYHVEKLPLTVIEQLRQAAPLPRPLSPESIASVRASLRDSSALPGLSISDEAIEQLQGHFQRRLWGPGYVDVTDSAHDGLADETQTHFVAPVSAPHYPKPDPSAHPELEPMLKMVNSSEIRSYVTDLSTKFSTRYYRSRNARDSAAWVQSRFVEWLGLNQTHLVENKFNQPNVVGRIEAKSGNASAPVLILGAHLDSTSQMPVFKAPGADDDASGLSVVMAIMRILKATDYQGSYAIEAHAYAGEEGGLLGSDAMAAEYKKQGKEIRGMLEFEMVGYQPSTASNAGKSSTITVLSDPIPAMSAHMIEVVKAYVPSAEQRSVNCGYGCSDHYSFYAKGYPVVCLAAYGPSDSHLNPNYHSVTDTADKLDFDKMTDFIRAGLGWVVEVAA